MENTNLIETQWPCILYTYSRHSNHPPRITASIHNYWTSRLHDWHSCHANAICVNSCFIQLWMSQRLSWMDTIAHVWNVLTEYNVCKIENKQRSRFISFRKSWQSFPFQTLMNVLNRRPATIVIWTRSVSTSLVPSTVLVTLVIQEMVKNAQVNNHAYAWLNQYFQLYCGCQCSCGLRCCVSFSLLLLILLFFVIFSCYCHHLL